MLSWICSVLVGGHALSQVYSKHGYAYLRDDKYILFYFCLQLPPDSRIPTPSHTCFCKVLCPSFFLMTSYFRGHMLHTYFSHLSEGVFFMVTRHVGEENYHMKVKILCAHVLFIFIKKKKLI
jgi:hypothetical protein